MVTEKDTASNSQSTWENSEIKVGDERINFFRLVAKNGVVVYGHISQFREYCDNFRVPINHQHNTEWWHFIVDESFDKTQIEKLRVLSYLKHKIGIFNSGNIGSNSFNGYEKLGTSHSNKSYLYSKEANFWRTNSWSEGNSEMYIHSEHEDYPSVDKLVTSLIKDQDWLESVTPVSLKELQTLFESDL